MLVVCILHFKAVDVFLVKKMQGTWLGETQDFIKVGSIVLGTNKHKVGHNIWSLMNPFNEIETIIIS